MPADRLHPGERTRAFLDETSRTWLRRLEGEASEREAAMRELHGLLLRGARYVVRQRRWAAILGEAEGEDLAVEAAGDALLAILGRVEEYRGDSRFTTWAYKFVFIEAAVAMRKRSWKTREIPLDDGEWARVETSGARSDEAERRQTLAALCTALDGLTSRQRFVFVAACLQGVPIDVLAARLHTTRGALYKTVHDARRKLRTELAEAGFWPVTARVTDGKTAANAAGGVVDAQRWI